MYSCVGIRAMRFIYSMLKLEGVTSGDVSNMMCSHVLYYERRGS